jgi:hypothetical protein
MEMSEIKHPTAPTPETSEAVLELPNVEQEPYLCNDHEYQHDLIRTDVIVFEFVKSAVVIATIVAVFVFVVWLWTSASGGV